MNRFKAALLLAFIIQCNVGAHVDPFGEINPHVNVITNSYMAGSEFISGTNFLIVYYNRYPVKGEKYTTVQNDSYQQFYNLEGQKIGVQEKTPYYDFFFQPVQLPEAYPEGSMGCRLTAGATDFFIPYCENYFYRREHDGSRKVIPVLTGELDLSFEGQAVLARGQIISPVKVGGERDINLVAIDSSSGEINSRCSLSQPARNIWGYAFKSNLIEYKGNVYIFWTTISEGRSLIMLSRWNPINDHLTSRQFSEITSYNTSLSVAHIGGKALLAYHAVPEKLDRSKISTVAIDLDVLSFEAEKYHNRNRLKGSD